MSSSGNPAGDKPQGFSKFIRRASRALKTRSASSGSPSGSPSTIGSPATGSKNLSVPKPSVIGKDDSSITKPASIQVDRAITSAASYAKNREEKARALFAKYGMTLAPDEWTSPAAGRTEWVEKKIVMRVHRQCHRCQTTFGFDKLCSQCQHTRCKKCPRFPSKLSKDQHGISGKGLLDSDYVAKLTVDPNFGLKGGKLSMIPLTMQTKSGREAVRKHPTHRVRRTCHRCDSLFVGRATVCEKCKHQRCPQCPREP
jgi:hypothetical protein